jgi:hypothetical protein
MTFRRTALALLACTFLAGPALADPPANKPPAVAQADWRLQRLKAAGVDEARAQRALKTMERFDAERKKLQQDAQTHHAALNKLLATKSTDEQAYARELVAARSADKRLRDLRDRQTDALLKILKPSEVARFQAQRPHAAQAKKPKQAGRKGGKKR